MLNALFNLLTVNANELNESQCYSNLPMFIRLSCNCVLVVHVYVFICFSTLKTLLMQQKCQCS